MRVIFLDIDGVLNNIARCHWLHENFQRGSGFGSWGELADGNITVETVGWDPVNVEALRFLLDETGAGIVITSTWRIMCDLDAIRSFFIPFNLTPNVIGETPRIRETGSIRGDEVAAWLEDRPEVERFVCLDDDGDFHPNQNLVQTTIDVGLTIEDARRAIEILTR